MTLFIAAIVAGEITIVLMWLRMCNQIKEWEKEIEEIEKEKDKL